MHQHNHLRGTDNIPLGQKHARAKPTGQTPTAKFGREDKRLLLKIGSKVIFEHFQTKVSYVLGPILLLLFSSI